MNRKVGHRFHPTDEELINHFLKNKVLDPDSDAEDDIVEVDICKFEPWELPKRAVNKSDDDPVWFFFCPRDYKYTNSRRANRTTKAGFWKATGKDRKIWSRKGPKKEIGIKKTLVFYKGRPPNGTRTNWVIHEYHPTAADFPNQNAYVISRLKKKADEKADDSIPDEGESSCHVTFDYGRISENTSPEDNQVLLSNLFNNGLVNYSSLAARGQNFPFPNLSRPQNYVYSSEQENEFIDSLIVDPFEETGHTHCNGSSSHKSLKKYGQVLGKSFIGHVSSKEYQRMQIVEASSGILQSSNRDSSVDSFTNIPEISCIESVSEEIPPHKSQYHPRSHKILAEEAVPPIVELQDDFSRKAVMTDMVGEASKHDTAFDMLEKENSKNKYLKMTKKTNTKSLKSSWNEPTGTDQKGFFIFLDTSQLSHNSNPPSVYLINAIVGIFLVIVVIRELIVFGDWC